MKTEGQDAARRDEMSKSNDAGLYRKYQVERLDGSSEPGGKHAQCEYFVLDLEHDPHARAALDAYADSCARTHPRLADDLREWLGGR